MRMDGEIFDHLRIVRFLRLAVAKKRTVVVTLRSGRLVEVAPVALDEAPDDTLMAVQAGSGVPSPIPLTFVSSIHLRRNRRAIVPQGLRPPGHSGP